MDRYNQLQNDVNGVKKVLHDKISVAFSAFSPTTQQTTSAIELQSISQTESHLVRPTKRTTSAIELQFISQTESHLVHPTKRTAGHSTTSHPKRMCLASPAHDTVCLFA